MSTNLLDWLRAHWYGRLLILLMFPAFIVLLMVGGTAYVAAYLLWSSLGPPIWFIATQEKELAEAKKVENPS